MKSFSDIIGIVLSGICAIQCAMLPILLSISTVLPGWAHFGHGWIWISIIGLVAAWSFYRGWKVHKSTQVLALAFIGFLTLMIATVLEDQIPLIYESLLFVIGGVLMVLAHWKNFQLSAACKT